MKMLMPLDELEILKANLIAKANPLTHRLDGVKASEIVDTVLDILIMAYVFGVRSANDDLGTNFKVNADRMKETIFEKVAGKTFAERIEEYTRSGTAEDIQRVAETEAHRCSNDGAFATAKLGGATRKTWHSMEDEKVRWQHDVMDLTTIPLEEDFISPDGDYGSYPGGFQTAENNCNCRCYLTFGK